MQHTSNIIELLKETAFPQMLLIDGSWGSGKTHYIKNELEVSLKDEFRAHELHYFSLYGISSIDDFRDRLISLTLTNNAETSNLVQRATQVVDSIATNMGERGIGGILNGAAGAYKYKLYSDLDNVVLVLDDLERISDSKTIKDILGECLNLAESKNIKVIVVANESKLCCKDDIEKVFIDKVKFGYTPEQVASILRDEFQEELSDALFNEFILHINSIGSSNIRVLKRALIKFKKLRRLIVNEAHVSQKTALSKILHQVIKICYAKFEVGYSSEEIKQSAQTYMTRIISTDKDSSSSLYEQKLDDILAGDISHEYLVDFCCEGIFKLENIVTELRLPTEKRLIDKIMNYSLIHQLTELEFQEGIGLLTAVIQSDCNLNISQWFSACDLFVHLTEKKYFSSELSSINIIDFCKNKKIECFDINQIPSRGAMRSFFNIEIHKLYNVKLKLLKEINQLSESESFTNSFHTSWESLENDIYQKYSHTPFLHKIGAETLINTLFNWSSNDVYCFANYMREKYSFSNIEDFLEPEHLIIKNTIEKLDTDALEPNLKTGAILGLKEVLVDINIKMIDRIALKNE